MNFIILEGMSLYLFLILLALMLLICLGSLVCTILADKKIHLLNNLLKTEEQKVAYLNQENLKIKLKYGELEQGE